MLSFFADSVLYNMDRLTIYACVYVDYSRLFFRVYVLLFSVDLLYSVNPIIIIIYKILHGDRSGMASLCLEPPASFLLLIQTNGHNGSDDLNNFD